LDVEQAEIRDQQLASARGRLVWERAAWAARAGSLPLGSFAVDISPVEGGVAGTVLTLSGGLNAEGDVRVLGEQYSVDVSLSGPAMDNEGLRQAMALFAVPDGNRYRVTLSGRLQSQ
jgi:hypothetical protein